MDKIQKEGKWVPRELNSGGTSETTGENSATASAANGSDHRTQMAQKKEVIINFAR